MLSPAEVGYDLTLYAHEWQSERLRLTRRLARRVAQKADPSTVHDVRVSCRRLREAIEFFHGVPELRPLSDVGRAARRLARSVRRLRELDVAVKRLNELLGMPALGRPRGASVTPDKLEATKEELVSVLKARRRKLANKRRKRIAKRAKELDRAMGENAPLRMRPRAAEVDSAREAELRAFVEARVTDRRKDVENLFQMLRGHGEKLGPDRRAACLHRIRVAVKHWRYTSEIARAVMPRVLYRPLAIRLRRLQELGGRSQDFADLVRIADKELGRHPPSREGRLLLAKIRAARGTASREFLEALKWLDGPDQIVNAG